MAILNNKQLFGQLTEFSQDHLFSNVMSMLSIRKKCKCLIYFLTAILLAAFYINQITIQNYAVIKDKVLDYTSVKKMYIIKKTEGTFWERTTLNEKYSHINHFQTKKAHQTLLLTTRACRRFVFVLLLITSHAENVERRNIIRKTWGIDQANISFPRWTTHFLIGRSNNYSTEASLKREQELNNDLVISNILENFYNLTYKIQGGFEWSLKYCDYKFLFKGDDDVFVNIPNLLQYIEKKNIPKTELYAGNVQFIAHVQRKGRYSVDKKEFRKRIYPRYCSGGGFILSRDAVQRLFARLPEVPALTIDDAYVGILALRAGIDVVHNKNFQMYAKTCEYSPTAIVFHPVKKKECMKYLYNNSRKDGL